MVLLLGIRVRRIKASLFLVFIILSVSPSHCLSNDNFKSTEGRNAVGISSSSLSQRRIQNENNSASSCPLCEGINLMADKIPPNIDSLSLESTMLGAGSMPYNNASCAEIDSGYQQTCSFGTSFIYEFYFKHCCEASIPLYECEKNVQDFILNDDYNAAIPPIARQDVPLDVGIDFVYMFLESIEAQKGTASVVFSLTYMWNDPRLAWDIIDFDTCTNFVSVWTGHDVEKTSIWIPSLNLLNRISGVQTFADVKATVDSNGNVMMRTEGSLQAFCSFKGLADIPFDTLGCQFIFGMTEKSHSYRLYSLDEETIQYSSFGLTAVYNEWLPLPKLATMGAMPTNDAIYINLYFQRAQNHYIFNIIIPTTTLTYLSFFTFLLDMRVGERLGFGMALTLVVIAQQIITSSMIVISNVSLWIDKFVGWSFYWVLFTMVQSVVIGFLYYVREDREAKKENKRLSMMSLEARAIMMSGARGDDEEVPLTDHLEDTGNRATFTKDKPTAHGGGDTSQTFRFCDISLRKVDYMCLAFAVMTYTAFVATMFSTVKKTDMWLSEDPTWFSNDGDGQDSLILQFKNGDPNSR